MPNNPILPLWMYKAKTFGTIESYKIQNDPILPNHLKIADDPVLLLWMYQAKPFGKILAKSKMAFNSTTADYQDTTIQ